MVAGFGTNRVHMAAAPSDMAAADILPEDPRSPADSWEEADRFGIGHVKAPEPGILHETCHWSSLDAEEHFGTQNWENVVACMGIQVEENSSCKTLKGFHHCPPMPQDHDSESRSI